MAALLQETTTYYAIAPGSESNVVVKGQIVGTDTYEVIKAWKAGSGRADIPPTLYILKKNSTGVPYLSRDYDTTSPSEVERRVYPEANEVSRRTGMIVQVGPVVTHSDYPSYVPPAPKGLVAAVNLVKTASDPGKEVALGQLQASLEGRLDIDLEVTAIHSFVRDVPVKTIQRSIPGTADFKAVTVERS